jgi:hypothetical protein
VVRGRIKELVPPVLLTGLRQPHDRRRLPGPQQPVGTGASARRSPGRPAADWAPGGPWNPAAISTIRPPLGPGQIAKYEHELSAYDGLGLDDVTVDHCLTYLLSFVQACARAASEARDAQRGTAMDDEQWWAASAPLLARVLDENAYPTAARVGAAAGAAHGSAYDPGHAYDFGLRRVLDGLAAIIDRA